jgi:hypothetical protein
MDAISTLPKPFGDTSRHLVRLNFNILRNANNTRRLVRRFPALNDFLVYVQRNYFDGNFPLTMWNVFDRNMDNRSNNFVESKFIDQDNICIF